MKINIRTIFVFVLVFTLYSMLSGQEQFNQYISNAVEIVESLKTIQNKSIKMTQNEGDLVVGLNNPDESMTITGSYSLSGNILIYNNGNINFNNANFQFDGDIFIYGHGRLNFNNSDINIIQKYIYEHSAVILDHGVISFSGTKFRSNGQSWGMGLSGDARLIMDNSEISDGFITTGFLERSSAEILNTKTPGEFLCFSNNSLKFRGCDFLLQWLVLPDSSIVDVSLPTDSLVNNWVFKDNGSSINGIPYSVDIDSCTNVLWGLISNTGSEAVFRNTEFRTIGLMFAGNDSVSISNITNESHQVDAEVNITDRDLRLVNCDVHTWSFYPSQGSKLTVINSVFGEIMSQDSSKVFVNNCVCDGTGGYVSAHNQSFMIIINSLIRSQVITRDNGILVGYESAFTGDHIESDESSIMVLANVQASVEPNAYSGSVIFKSEIKPVTGECNTTVPIKGTAEIVSGQDIDIQLKNYRVEYSDSFTDPFWKPTDGVHREPVIDDTLALWNTKGILPGDYLIRLTMIHSFGDSISVNSYARLNPQTDVRFIKTEKPDKFSLSQNFPNPFNSSTTITFSLSESSHVSLLLYDVRGVLVSKIVDEVKNKGHYTVIVNCSDLPTGLYFYSLTAGTYVSSRKLMIVR